MGEVSHSCRMLALLALNERSGDGSGCRLIEWAALCKADGVILSWRQKAEPGIVERLSADARKAHLSCYLEPQPNGLAPMIPGIDGYWISDPDDWSLNTLQHLGRTTFICVKDAKQLRPYLQTLREASFVYVDGGQPSGTWFTVWQACSRTGRRRTLGYLDDHPGFMEAIERTTYAPCVVKRLALTRHGAGLAQDAALLPYEFSMLVRVARGTWEYFPPEKW